MTGWGYAPPLAHGAGTGEGRGYAAHGAGNNPRPCGAPPSADGGLRRSAFKKVLRRSAFKKSYGGVCSKDLTEERFKAPFRRRGWREAPGVVPPQPPSNSPYLIFDI
ncbi:MAG: hypothetical protein LBM98_08365 [Oscillospiraceae bacterium]|nr:hypothetical protein [Oscillospiraceae bacterium]